MQMIHKQIWRTAFAATSLACVAMLSGCGGASNGTPLLTTPLSGPAVNGLSANDILNNQGTLIELSGLASADAQTAYLTGAVASTAKPSSVVANAFGGTIPLGFAPDGSFGVSGSNIGTAVAPGASVLFGASISGGNSTTAPIAINPNGVVLTSSEVPGFSQPLKFTASEAQTGPLVAAQYTTAAFKLPFTTTGLHSLVASVSDASGQSSTTTFDTVVLTSTDAAVYAQITDAKGNPLPGATATITGQINPAAPATQQATADDNGVVILFATPGVPDKSNNTNTITVTAPKHTFADTPVTLTAGAILTRIPAPTKDKPDAVAPLAISSNE